MIKRITALFLIVTATAVLLADYFVPHQHHGTSVCFDWSHCSSDHHAGEFAGSSNHQHDSEDDCGSCRLKQAITLPSSQISLNIKQIPSFNQIYLSSMLLQKITFEELSFSSPDYKDLTWILLHKYNIDRCVKGLRAPPVQRG